MKKPITLREIICFGAALLCAYFAFVKKYDNVTLQEDKIRAEEKVKYLEQRDSTKTQFIDSLKTNVKVLEGIVDYQKKNPKLIIEKHDKIRNNVNLLNADGSISYFSDRLSKESGNR